MNSVLEKLTKEKIKEIIAKRAAKEFKDGDIVTLGIGFPTAVANYIPENVNILLQSENGLLGVGKDAEIPNDKIINAGGGHVGLVKGACFYDKIIRFCR